MKKVFLFLFIFTFCSISIQGEEVESYLTKYEKFVTEVSQMETITPDDKLYLDSIFTSFTDEYHDVYKSEMTNSQLSKYMELRTTYKKKIALRNSDKVGDDIEAFNAKTFENAKRTGSKVSGFFKGLFKKKK